MTNQNEDIFLKLHNVKYKKSNGSLCLSNKKVGWIIENEENFTVHVAYAEIRSQKVSPEAKPKVQLQLVLLDQTTYTFHFANPASRDVQIAERNSIKEKLTQLILQNKRKPPDELMEKKRILEENPHLKELYMSLVSNAILTADDFWKQIAGEYKETLEPKLDVGISGAFLADIKPQTDGSNGRVLYNLNPEIMVSIFKTYPNVKRKHEEYVPHKMTESEFWTRFFQSHYYSVHSTSRSENVFSESAKHDDKEWVRELNSIRSDPLYDLNDIYEDEALENEEDLAFITNRSGNHIHATMIKRFNQHSLNILKAQTVSEKEKICDEILAKNPDAVVNGEADAQLQQNKPKRIRIDEKLQYEDLASKGQAKTSSLVINQKDRYLTSSSVNIVKNGHSNNHGFLQQGLTPSVEKWSSSLYSSMNYKWSSHTLQVASEECRTGRSSVTTRSGDALPEHLQAELSKVYSSAGELLRHFWACFPPRTTELKDKVHRMHYTINQYQKMTVTEFQSFAMREYNCKSSVLEHLLELFMIANNKYESWKARMRNGH